MGRLMSEFTDSVPGTTVVLQVTLHHREIEPCPVLRVDGEENVVKLTLKGSEVGTGTGPE